ncbi:MAG: hypothetical protein WDA18_09685 [Candidatus Ratteibacteria bacterium]
MDKKLQKLIRWLKEFGAADFCSTQDRRESEVAVSCLAEEVLLPWTNTTIELLAKEGFTVKKMPEDFFFYLGEINTPNGEIRFG